MCNGFIKRVRWLIARSGVHEEAGVDRIVGGKANVEDSGRFYFFNFIILNSAVLGHDSLSAHSLS